MKEEILSEVKKLNLTPEQLTKLEELNPKFDRIVEDAQAIIEAKYTKELKDLKDEKSTFEDTTRKDIAKLGKLVDSKVVESLNKAKEIPVKELLEMATTNIEKMLKDNNAKTDEKVTKELDDIKIKYDDLMKTVEEKETTFKKEKEDLEIKYNNDLYERKLDTLIEVRAKVEKWKDKDSVDLYKKEVKEKILASGKVNDDGSMIGLNSDVCTIDGKRVKHIDEAWPLIVAKRVAASEPGKDGDGTKKIETDKTQFNQMNPLSIKDRIAADKAYANEQTYATT